MSGERPGYLAYLLRMWRVEEGGGPRWRASLERPSDGERISFPTLEAALDFLVESTKEGRKELPIPPDEPGRGIKDG